MEFIIILVLIALNGIFSMSEIALVSVRKVRLEGAAKKGNKSARHALNLANSPDRFLSTVQIGITLIGIFMGMYSGKNFSVKLEAFLSQFEPVRSYAAVLAPAIILIVITFLTLVLGELVPKRIGMTNPEAISRIVAVPMNILSRITAPFIWLLSAATNFMLRVMNIRKNKDNRVTEEEIKAIVQEGTEGGEVQEVEQDIVERVFFLGDRKIGSLATHRSDLVWIDINDTADDIKKKVVDNIHYMYPVANKSLDNLLGIVLLKHLFLHIDKPDFFLPKYIHKAPFIHEGQSVYSVLAQLKESKTYYAFITDDYGSIDGLVTMNDILEALVGEISEEEERPVTREDGSVLMDGQYSFYDFLSYYDLQSLYPDYPFNTLSGLILEQLKHIPATGEKLSWRDFSFEIVDMDGARIDKVLVERKSKL